ncbi:MAG: GspH/FimT family pseudopilin [Acidobacteriota bacterium]
MDSRMRKNGFSLLEVLVIMGIMGAMMLAMYPSIMNSLETRDLENSARDVQTTLQQARYRAVTDKIHCRVRFAQSGGFWQMHLESLEADGTWIRITGIPPREISNKFTVTLGLPSSQTVEFSPVGIVEGYDSTNNSLTLQSRKLKAKGQQDLRVLTIFGGGTISYAKATSG